MSIHPNSRAHEIACCMIGLVCVMITPDWIFWVGGDYLSCDPIVGRLVALTPILICGRATQVSLSPILLH